MGCSKPKQEVETSSKTNEIEGVRSQRQKLDVDELRLQHFDTKFNLKDFPGLEDQSTSSGLSNVVQKPHLLRYVSWRNYLIYWSIEWV